MVWGMGSRSDLRGAGQRRRGWPRTPPLHPIPEDPRVRGFRVYDSGFRVQGSGFEVWRVRVKGLRFRV